MDKVQQQTILNHCKKGEFQSALELIHLHLQNIDIGIKLIVTCCHSCLNINTNICTETLYKLLKCIVPTIGKPNESELVSYIQSVYHILSSFIKKDALNIITQMEDILLPTFLTSKLSKKHKDIYNSVVVILYNLVARHAMNNDTSKNMFMLKISLLISKISSTILEPLDALNKSYKCFTNLVCLKISDDEQREYYKEVLTSSIRIYNGKSKDEYFKVILTFSSIILNNILKTFDFQWAWDFFQTISDTLKQNSAQIEFMCIFQVLKSCFIISPIEIESKNIKELIKCTKSLETLDEMMETSDIQQKLREKLLIMLKNVTTCYQTVRRKEWAAIPEISQVEIMEFIADITNNKVHYNHSPTSLQIILQLIDVQIKLKPNSSLNYHEKCLNILEMFSNQMMSMKEHNSVEWINLWNIMEVRAYNIGVHLWKTSNTNDTALLYLNFLLKMHIKLDCKNNSLVLKQNALSNCLKVICEINSENSKSYLMHTALAIFLCPSSMESFMNNWIKFKYSKRDIKAPRFEETQEITLVTALGFLQQDSPLFENLWNNFDKLQLLKLELQQYKRRWKSKVPIMSVLKELHKLPDIDGVAETIVDIFGDCELPVHEDCLVILIDILFRYKDKIGTTSNIKSNIYLGVLYYVTYKYCIIQIISKNAEDMAKMSVLLSDTELTGGINSKDSKEDCDVVSSYESSVLEKYITKLNFLDESLNIFLSVLPGLNETTSKIGCVTHSQLYNILLHISYEYRLLKHKLRCLQASQLALKFATLQNNIVGIVQMTGFIIEFTDLKMNNLHDIIKKADYLIENVDLSDFESLSVVMIYYICKSKALFSYDLEESYKAFRLCTELYKSRKCKEDGFIIVKSQLHLLKFKFTTLPCELGIEIHHENTLMDVNNAVEIIFKVYGREHFGNPYAMSILLDANEELVKLYHLMLCPREVYAYGREILLLCQKLVSPLRCATFLMYVAHADLRTNSLPDCRDKLQAMANILCSFNKNPEASTLEEEESSERGKHLRELLPSSPKIELETFRLPSVVSHGASCDCFYCVCCEYQVLLLEKTRLDALLNMKLKNDSIARDYFRGALDLYGHFDRQTISNPEKFAGIIDSEVLPEFKKDFVSPHGFTLLNFSSFLDWNDKKAEAFDMNEELLEFLVGKKNDFVYLYNEAVVQKCIYLTKSIVPESPQDSESDMEYYLKQDAPEASKTPETKFTKISFPVKCKTPDISPQMQKPINKRLVFPLSPPEQAIGTTSKKRVQKSKTPLPKIKIYTETPEMKSTNKKSRCQTLQVPSTSKGALGASSFGADLENGMKTRTRLLTEKLKKTSKVKEPCTIEKSSRASVKKNLMHELAESSNEATSTSKSGAIRKSTRNKT